MPSRILSSVDFARFRLTRFANAIVVLYLTSALLGAVVYLYFKIDIQPYLERDRHWHAMGFLDLKEDFVVIGLGVLPAYWFCWGRPDNGEHHHIRTTLTVPWRSLSGGPFSLVTL
jgi:hypothetical protein